VAFVPASSLASGGGGGAVTQGTVPWVVDGSAVTQPVSVAALPLPTGAASEATLADVLDNASEVALNAVLEREKLCLPT
jgi:hypothetical protein